MYSQTKFICEPNSYANQIHPQHSRPKMSPFEHLLINGVAFPLQLRCTYSHSRANHFTASAASMKEITRLQLCCIYVTFFAKWWCFRLDFGSFFGASDEAIYVIFRSLWIWLIRKRKFIEKCAMKSIESWMRRSVHSLKLMYKHRGGIEVACDLIECTQRTIWNKRTATRTSIIFIV